MPNDLLDALTGVDSDVRFEVDMGPDGRVLSSNELMAMVMRGARGLRQSGIGAGDLVLYQGLQSVEAFVLFWAAQWLGAIFSPIDDEWPDYLTARATSALRPKLVAAAMGRLDVFRRLFPHAMLLGLSPAATGEAPTPNFQQWLDGCEPVESASAVAADSASAYLFTSGTTAVPKAVILSRAALLHGGRLTLDTFEWRPGDRLVNLPEPHTMSGLRNAFVAAPLGSLVWCCVAAERRRNAFEVVAMLKESRCRRLVAGPALMTYLTSMGDRLTPADMQCLAAIYTTGATLNWRAAADFHARFGIAVVNYYGLTETGGLCVSQRASDWQPGDRSIGFPVGCAIRIVADPGEIESRDGDAGELQISSAQLMSGYLDDREQTAARFDGEWLRTGDRVRRDATGRLFLAGRSALFIKTATTLRVHPEEIETVLEEHDGVAEAGVTGVATEKDIERIAALVVMRENHGAMPDLPRQLVDFVTDRLGRARAPSQIRFVAKLPRLPSGKLDRRRMREVLS